MDQLDRVPLNAGLLAGGALVYPSWKDRKQNPYQIYAVFEPSALDQ